MLKALFGKKIDLTPAESGALSSMVDEIAEDAEEAEGANEDVAEALSLYEDVKVVWNMKFNTENGILGWFSWLRPSIIMLSPVFKCFVSNTVLKETLPMLAHELHHKKQFRGSPIIYVIGLVWPFRYLIEDSANEVETSTEDMVSRMDDLK